MTPEEIRKSQKRLEEKYLQEKQNIVRQQKQIGEELDTFRKEAERLREKVIHLTKKDTWDKRKFNREMEQSESMIRQEARRFTEELEEEQKVLKKNYQKAIEKIEKN